MKLCKYISAIIIFVLSLIFFISGVGCDLKTTRSDEDNPYLKRNTLVLDESLSLDYLILLPEGYDPERSFPAILAIPPGGQSVNEAEWAIDLYYIRESIQRNWLVVSPIAPNNTLFHEGSEIYIPYLLDEVKKSFNIEEDRFHLAGISSGGISAFRLAAGWPDLFQSVTVFPGAPTENDKRYLDHLIDLRITMYVGEYDDAEWINETLETASTLDSLGAKVEYKIWEANGHVITSLKPKQLFDLFESYRAE